MLEDISFKDYRPGLPGTPDLEKASTHLSIGWVEYRATLTPKYWIVWRDVVLCYLLLLLGVVALIFTQNIFNISWFGLVIALVLAVWIGYWLHAISLFLHEAVHYNVHPDPKKNDWWTNLIICPLHFISVDLYRKIHWPHHLNLGTPEDTEQSYFNALSLRFIFETLSGVHAFRTLFSYYNHYRQPANKTVASNSFRWNDSLKFVLVHLAILGVFIFFGQYLAAGGWAVGVGVFWPFFGTIRQLLRQRSENADPAIDYYKMPHGTTMRMFGDDWFSKTFGPAGFNRHMLHHWDPRISYTRLKDVEEYFKKTPLAPTIKSGRTSYWSIAKILFKKSKSIK